jgi:hypothetical protein
LLELAVSPSRGRFSDLEPTAILQEAIGLTEIIGIVLSPISERENTATSSVSWANPVAAISQAITEFAFIGVGGTCGLYLF